MPLAHTLPMNGLPYDKDGNYPGHVCRKGHLTTNTKSSLAGQPQKDTASWLKKQVAPLAHPACKGHLWFFSFVLALARCSRNWPWPQHSLQQGHVIAAAKYTHENAERCAHPPYHALHSRRLTRSQSDSSSPNPCQSIHVRNYAGAGPSFEMAAIDLSCGGCAAERPLRLTRLSYRCNDPTLSSMQRGRRQRGIATESLTLSVPTVVCVGGTRSSQRRDVHARSEERTRACARVPDSRSPVQHPHVALPHLVGIFSFSQILLPRFAIGTQGHQDMSQRPTRPRQEQTPEPFSRPVFLIQKFGRAATRDNPNVTSSIDFLVLRARPSAAHTEIQEHACPCATPDAHAHMYLSVRGPERSWSGSHTGPAPVSPVVFTAPHHCVLLY